MTFQQKNVTGTLVSFSAILVFYLISFLRMVVSGPLESRPLFRLWFIVIGLAIVVTVVVLILTHMVSTAALAIRTRDDDPYIEDIEDERDKLIKLKGTRVTHTALSLGVFGSMVSFIFSQNGLALFAFLVMAGLLSEIIGNIAQLVLYRRDM